MLGEHKNAVLQFSGGKDSTALLYLARPYLDKITVLFSETGATFPHLRKHVEQTCQALGAKLVVVHPPVDVHQHTLDYGLPADVVPVEATAQAMLFMNPPPQQMLQPYSQCCAAMIWNPMAKYITEHKVDLVLRGSKAADSRVGVGPCVEENGITYKSPLWDWDDDRVYSYLKEQGASLPEHYPAINDSLDCWICTAHLGHHGDQKMAYIRERYPEKWPIVVERMTRMRNVLGREIAKIGPALEIGCA